MKTISINPQPFWGAQIRTDWFNDISAIKDWDKTFSTISKLGFTQVRYQIGIRDTFQNQIGATIPFIFLAGQDKWLRRIEPVLKYCAVYKMKLLLVIDDIPACVDIWGVDGVVTLLQRVIDRVGSRARYTFGELDPQNFESIIGVYDEIVSRLNFRGNELQAPPMLVMPFEPWQKSLADFMTSPLAAKCAVNTIDIYVDMRYSTNYESTYVGLLTEAKVVLKTSTKPFSIHETGLCPNYAQVDDEKRGKMILQTERYIYRVGGFRDYGIYCTNEGTDVPSNSQFSILNPNVLSGYVQASGFASAIIPPLGIPL